MSYSATFTKTIHAPIQSVWDAWTKPELLKQFFFGTDMETDWRVGGPIYFRGSWDGKSYEDKGTVLSWNPMKDFSYDYWSSMSGTPDVPENYMTISFHFEEVSDGTQMTLVQSNVASQKQADDSTGNWSMVTDLLEKFLTVGS